MRIYTYTLLTDGSSDEALMPMIDWLINQHFSDMRFQSQFVRGLGKVGSDLLSRIDAALRQFPCDVLILHRDAEKESHAIRSAEVRRASDQRNQCCVSVVPVKMTEAWMLSDEPAIRAAAGNRYGKNALELPSKTQWELLNDPKQVLLDALAKASEKSGRALQKFQTQKHRHSVTRLTRSFSALRGLRAFDAFENEFVQQINKLRNKLDHK